MSLVVLITGASSGIGRETAKLFQSKGWSVVAAMRAPEKETILNHLPNVVCVPLDVTKESSIEAGIKAGMHAFGKIDVVVNNAGYGAVGAFELASGEQIQKQFDVNVFGLMSVTRALLPHFRALRSGMIINIASIGGRITFPLYSVYHATKWAVEGFSESLAFELKQWGIKVKIIEPGAVKTDFYGRSQEVFVQNTIKDYDEYQRKTLGAAQRFGSKGVKPEVVANMIYRAATDGSKRLRYPVGGSAPLLLWIRRILPDRWFNFLIDSVFKK